MTQWFQFYNSDPTSHYNQRKLLIWVTWRACNSDSAASLLLLCKSVIIFHTSDGFPAIFESRDNWAKFWNPRSWAFSCLWIENNTWGSKARPNNVWQAKIPGHFSEIPISIHLIPKWRPINYSFVCMLISPLRLIFTSKFFCFLYMLTRRRGLINMQTKE